MTTDTEFMLAGSASRVLGVSYRYVIDLAERGILPLAGRTPEGWRIYRASDVRRLAAEREARRRRPTTPSTPTAA